MSDKQTTEQSIDFQGSTAPSFTNQSTQVHINLHPQVNKFFNKDSIEELGLTSQMSIMNIANCIDRDQKKQKSLKVQKESEELTQVQKDTLNQRRKSSIQEQIKLSQQQQQQQPILHQQENIIVKRKNSLEDIDEQLEENQEDESLSKDLTSLEIVTPANLHDHKCRLRLPKASLKAQNLNDNSSSANSTPSKEVQTQQQQQKQNQNENIECFQKEENQEKNVREEIQNDQNNLDEIDEKKQTYEEEKFQFEELICTCQKNKIVQDQNNLQKHQQKAKFLNSLPEIVINNNNLIQQQLNLQKNSNNLKDNKPIQEIKQQQQIFFSQNNVQINNKFNGQQFFNNNNNNNINNINNYQMFEQDQNQNQNLQLQQQQLQQKQIQIQPNHPNIFIEINNKFTKNLNNIYSTNTNNQQNSEFNTQQQQNLYSQQQQQQQIQPSNLNNINFQQNGLQKQQVNNNLNNFNKNSFNQINIFQNNLNNNYNQNFITQYQQIQQNQNNNNMNENINYQQQNTVNYQQQQFQNQTQEQQQQQMSSSTTMSHEYNLYIQNVANSKLIENITDLSTYVNPIFIQENKKSQVIYIKGVNYNDCNERMLFNLFGNFGNIRKLILCQTKNSALMEFENLEFATQAKDYLNNKVFLGNKLKIFYSSYNNIVSQNKVNSTQMDKTTYQNNSASSDKYFEENPKFFRYKSNVDPKTIPMNPSSEILHISNLKPSACKYDIICNLFGIYGKIEKIQFQERLNKKHMCLLKYSSLEEAFLAMAYLHGTELFGSKLYISFTRSKF